MKFLLGVLLVGFAGIGRGKQLPLDPALGMATIPLYDGPAPGGDTAEVPTLTVFRPQGGHGNGGSVVIAPGGAYINLAANLEGRQVADWFAARGFTAFVLKYRLGAKNVYPVPLLDAERAIRLVRSKAGVYGFQAGRVGMVGFSAGGHLAAATATLSDMVKPLTDDAVDRLSARPDWVVLGYPWLDAMEPAVGHEITYCSILKEIPRAECAGFAEPYTPKLHVTGQTPTTFIFATTDDETVPVRASVEFYDAMLKAGAPVEMHLFRHGPHGTGLGGGDAALDVWPVLLEEWLRGQGLLSKN